MNDYLHLRDLNSENRLTIFVMSENDEEKTIELASSVVEEYLNLIIGELIRGNDGISTGVVKELGCWTEDHLPITTIFDTDFPNWEVGTSVRITFKNPTDEEEFFENGNGFIERF